MEQQAYSNARRCRSFVHFGSVEDGASPLSALETLQSFRSGIEERCLDLPQTSDAAIIGNYQMLDGQQRDVA